MANAETTFWVELYVILLNVGYYGVFMCVWFPAEVTSLPSGKSKITCNSDSTRIHVQYDSQGGDDVITVTRGDIQKMLHVCEGQSTCMFQSSTTGRTGEDTVTLNFVCTLVTNNGKNTNFIVLHIMSQTLTSNGIHQYFVFPIISFKPIR